MYFRLIIFKLKPNYPYLKPESAQILTVRGIIRNSVTYIPPFLSSLQFWRFLLTGIKNNAYFSKISLKQASSLILLNQAEPKLKGIVLKNFNKNCWV